MFLVFQLLFFLIILGSGIFVLWCRDFSLTLPVFLIMTFGMAMEVLLEKAYFSALVLAVVGGLFFCLFKWFLERFQRIRIFEESILK